MNEDETVLTKYSRCCSCNASFHVNNIVNAVVECTYDI